MALLAGHRPGSIVFRIRVAASAGLTQAVVLSLGLPGSAPLGVQAAFRARLAAGVKSFLSVAPQCVAAGALDIPVLKDSLEVLVALLAPVCLILFKPGLVPFLIP